MKTHFCAVVLLSVLTLSSYAHSVFGEPGSGRPTNTGVGVVTGAAAGAAIGQAVGGKDGWWIGALLGSVTGGSVGNAWPTDEERYAQRHYAPQHVTHVRHVPTYTSRSVYRPVPVRRVVCREVVHVRPVRHVSYVSCHTATPYGHILSGGVIRSPWSNFQMDVGGLSPGQTVYDAHTGKPFLVP